MVHHSGGCHCGTIRFRIKAPEKLKALDCNCSICSKVAFLHVIVPKNNFSLLSGSTYLMEYTFNTKQARHLFCKKCGIKSFYVPRSHPSSYSVNARCLDSGTYKALEVEQFDGLHWESAISGLEKG